MRTSPNTSHANLPPTHPPEAPSSPIDIQRLLAQGVEQHQQGRLSEAEALYEQVLSQAPDNFSALQLMGTLYAQTDQPLAAMAYLSKAIGIDATFAPCYNNLGLALIALNRLEEALANYDLAIRLMPEYAEAYANRGVALKALNRLDAAIASYDQAIAINPGYAEAYSNRGNALQALRRFDEALASYDHAIAINPHYVEAYCNRGVVLQALKYFDEAVVNYNQAIAINPAFVEAYANRGVVLQTLKRQEEALDSFDQAIAIKPHYAEAYFNRGVVLLARERLEEALFSFEQAIVYKADYAEAYANRGIVLQSLKRFDDALASYDQAIHIRPGYAHAYFNRGVALQAQALLEAALASYNQAIAMQPDYAEAYFNRGVGLQALQRFEEALTSYDQAIALKPDYAEAYSNRGVILQLLKRFDTALASLEQAISLNPAYANAYFNQGIVLHALGQMDAAIACFDQAIRLQPDNAKVHWNRALALLLNGQFLLGWQDYEWRWKNEEISNIAGLRHFEQPLWLGMQSLKGKTILLYAEQGLGDTLQFSRYVPLVAQLGATVILDVQRPLLQFLSSLEGVSHIVARGEALPAFDYQCPLLSLPLAFNTTLESIPAVAPPQTILDAQRVKWQNKLGKQTRPRVGLVWSGSLQHKNDTHRSLTLAQLRPYLPSGIEYVCLQKECRQQDLACLKQAPEIQFYGDALIDFTDTAALCALMDVIISVDTSVAHLAGTLGKKTWLLLPFCPDWRWLLNRTESPWYPSITLYRQAHIDDWESVLQQISRDLAALL